MEHWLHPTHSFCKFWNNKRVVAVGTLENGRNEIINKMHAASTLNKMDAVSTLNKMDAVSAVNTREAMYV